ncbi:MAG TPA: PD-(D/E)XK motif protein, partial [Longimicrobium sp.]|nr:PD-(D/E)XK motif protein [Longimicrobium sp.]
CLTGISESENAGEALLEIVKSVREALSADIREDFDDRLLQTGLIPAHYQLYSAPRYVIRWRTLYRIEEGFPRLLASSLPPGVEDVTYAVAVAACTPFTVPLTATLDSITSLRADT